MARTQNCRGRHKWEAGLNSVEVKRKAEHRAVNSKKLGYNYILFGK